MYPVFVLDAPDEVQEIKTMPGISRFGYKKIVGHLEPLVKKVSFCCANRIANGVFLSLML